MTRLLNDARIELRLPSQMLQEIKQVKGDVALSVWIRRALEERLCGEVVPRAEVERLREALYEAKGKVPASYADLHRRLADAIYGRSEDRGVPPITEHV